MSIPPHVTSIRVDDAVNIIASGGPVSLDMLRGVLKVGEIYTEILVFNNRKLASACVKLLQERSKKYSVLDDEFNVCCLKIILLGLQVATLLACKTMYAYAEQAPDEPDPNFTLAKFAATSLADKIKVSIAGGPDPALDPFITVAEAVTLLECLHRERDRFLFNRVAYYKLWGGWSFVIFPAWGYLVIGRISE
ncbi:hypothetical protein FRC07_000355 [Ceratobasidium sp. 392]|nr:hypothetical protein FRC07_000355 [Ceratobasidium sp. 392]